MNVFFCSERPPWGVGSKLAITGWHFFLCKITCDRLESVSVGRWSAFQSLCNHTQRKMQNQEFLPSKKFPLAQACWLAKLQTRVSLNLFSLGLVTHFALSHSLLNLSRFSSLFCLYLCVCVCAHTCVHTCMCYPAGICRSEHNLWELEVLSFYHVIWGVN